MRRLVLSPVHELRCGPIVHHKQPSTEERIALRRQVRDHETVRQPSLKASSAGDPSGRLLPSTRMANFSGIDDMRRQRPIGEILHARLQRLF